MKKANYNPPYVINGLWPYQFLVSKMLHAKITIENISLLVRISKLSSFGAEIIIPRFSELELESIEKSCNLKFKINKSKITIEKLEIIFSKETRHLL